MTRRRDDDGADDRGRYPRPEANADCSAVTRRPGRASTPGDDPEGDGLERQARRVSTRSAWSQRDDRRGRQPRRSQWPGDRGRDADDGSE